MLRTERKALQNPLFRAPVAEQEIVKKSLGEVYEEQYQKTQGVLFQFLWGFYSNVENFNLYYGSSFYLIKCSILLLQAGKEEKKNEKHEEIKKLVSELFQKLNALCHYRYIPPEVSF